MQHIRIEDAPTLPSTPVLDLLAVVLSTNPDYLPGVATGAVTAREWYTRKQPEQVFLAYAPGGELAGHAGLRFNGARPDKTLLPRPLSWELAMVFVRPGYRGCGVARQLAQHATTQVRPGVLWASARREGTGSQVAQRVGWTRLPEHDFHWPDSPVGSIWTPPVTR